MRYTKIRIFRDIVVNSRGMINFVMKSRSAMRKYLLLFTLLLLPWALYGQEDTLRLGYSVQGTVVDAVTGRPLEAVHVSIPDRHHATVTNADGQFTIKSDVPFSQVVFSHLGYRTYHQPTASGDLRVRMLPESISLDEASIISGSPYEIVQAALDRVRENYSDHPELLECFYRETIRKRNRYTYISEAVSRIYKTAYTGGIFRDRTALEKSRVLLSQRRTDTLSIKVQGGPTQAVTFDVVKNPDILFDREEWKGYTLEMGQPAYIGDRLQFVVLFRPGPEPCEWARYRGTLYIDRELLSFSRIEMSLDMSDVNKAIRMMLIRKPLSLRFTPKELSVVINYSLKDGKSRLEYFRSTIRFNCDWRKRLFATSYTAVNELVVTDLREPAVPIARSEQFRTSDILSDKAAEFLDPDFWKDYNIIEPTESLEHAIGRLRKGR